MIASVLEAVTEARLHQIRKLGHWACHLMDKSLERETCYQDMLRQLAIANVDDQVIVERVYRDIAAMGRLILVERVNEVLHTC